MQPCCNNCYFSGVDVMAEKDLLLDGNKLIIVYETPLEAELAFECWKIVNGGRKKMKY